MLQNALIIDQIGSAKIISDSLIPDPGVDEILVKIEAVALNPFDYKVVDRFGLPGNHIGCDYAGIVEKVGSEVGARFCRGDRVAGMIHGGSLKLYL